MSADMDLSMNADMGTDEYVNASVSMNALGLAYLGDAVFELYVRSMLIGDGCRPSRDLNRAARRYVTARAQAQMYHHIFETLTAEEQTVMKRGRNLHTTTRAKRTDMTDYRHATGLEALFGYLYLQGRQQRIAEVFAWCASTVTAPTETKG